MREYCITPKQQLQQKSDDDLGPVEIHAELPHFPAPGKIAGELPGFISESETIGSLGGWS